MPLTDAAVRNAKPTTKPAKLFDRGGLFLLIQPKGHAAAKKEFAKKGLGGARVDEIAECADANKRMI